MRHTLIICLLGVASSVAAQPVAFDSVRLADTIMETGWSTLEQALPLLISGFESQLKAGGVTESGARIFGEEFRRSLTKDNLSKAYAVAVTAKLSPEEIREVNGFLQSKTGQKYLSLSKELASNPAFVKPIVKQACGGAMQRLDAGADRSNIAGMCNQL